MATFYDNLCIEIGDRCFWKNRMNVDEVTFPTIMVTTLKEHYPKIDKVIFNDKTTIIFWNDHTKTVVKCQDGDTFSEEARIALCFMKKMLGNKGNYNKVLREALEKGDRK